MMTNVLITGDGGDGGDGGPARTADSRRDLTAREHEILGCMADGIPPKVIATRMGITVNTVRGHVKSIYWKLDVHSQLEAVAIARRQGLLTGS